MRSLFLLATVLIAACLYEAHIYFKSIDGLGSLDSRIHTAKEKIDPRDFCFALMGDSRNDRGVFPSIIEKIDDDPEISFVIHLGDAVMAPRKVFYLELVKTLQKRLHKPIFIIPGNHDIGSLPGYSLYKATFGPRHYSFNLGNIRFVMVDSNALRTAPEKEKKWIKKALSKDGSALNTLVFMHVPLLDPRGHSARHCLTRRLARELTGIFKSAHVKHVFSGHIHGYWSGFFKGLSYTISGGAGAWLHSWKPAHGFYHYLKVCIRGNRISWKVIKVQKAFLPGLLSYLYYSNLTGTELLFLACFLAAIVKVGMECARKSKG